MELSISKAQILHSAISIINHQSSINIFFSHQSILNIGAMIGGPFGGWVIDFFGRKLALMITALPFSAGWLMIGFGSNEVWLHAGRFLSGLGVGMASLIVPVSKYSRTKNHLLSNFCLYS